LGRAVSASPRLSCTEPAWNAASDSAELTLENERHNA
jgi:hypothetical protein